MATLDYETADLFYFTGPYHSTPNCPIKLDIDFNPSSGVPFYQSSDKNCSRTASYNIPFFLGKPGPRYEAVTLAAHEARPGHHTQVSRTQRGSFYKLFQSQPISCHNGLSEKKSNIPRELANGLLRGKT